MKTPTIRLQKWLIFLLPLLFCLSSCDEDKLLWKGYQEVKLGKTYFGDKSTKKVLFKFNDEAVKKGSYINLRLVDKQAKPISYAELIFNDQVSEKGVLKVRASDLGQDSIVQMGLRFVDRSVEPGFSNLFKLSRSTKYEGQILLETNAVSLDYVNDQALSDIGPLGWSVRLMVPFWKYLLFVLSIVFLSLLITWFLFIRPLMFPHFSGGEFNFDWPQHKKIRLKGKRLVYLGGEKIIKQGLLSRIFTGKIEQYLKDEPYLIELQPKRKGLRTEVRLKTKTGIDIRPYTRGIIKDFEEFEIKQSGKKDVKFRFQKSR